MMSDMSAAADTRAAITGGPTTPAVPPSPPANRATRSRWRDPRLVVGVALVALSVLLGARLLGAADDTVGVWTASRALKAGQPLVAADLVRRQVRFGTQEDADRYLSADQPPAAGLTVQRDVGAGELVPRGAVVASTGQNLTEVPLAVDTGAVPATVGVGAVVDVWVAPDSSAGDLASSGRSGAPADATLVFHDVTVLAAPRGGTSLGPSATRQVIVGVGADQERTLPTALAALGRGTVLVTRHR